MNSGGVTLNNDGEIVMHDDYLQNNQEKKTKRYRSAFTTEQINYLESEFKKFRYIGNANRKEVANILKISERAVKIWFQNRRMKEKREAGNRDVNLEDKYKIKAVFSNGQLNNNCKVQLSNDRRTFNKLLPTSLNDFSKESNVEKKKAHITFNRPHSSNEFKYIKNVNSNKQNTDVLTATKDGCNLERFKSCAPQKIRNDKRKITVQQNLNRKNSCLMHYSTIDKQHNKVNSLMSSHAAKEGNEVVQDLSLNGSLVNRPQGNNFYPVQSNPSQRFVPFYTQNYFVPQPVPAAINSGNVIWKPISLMPIMPGVSSPPVTIAHNNPGFSLNRDATKGTCNCHGPPHEINPSMQRGARIQPQYVLAVPFSNPLHKY